MLNYYHKYKYMDKQFINLQSHQYQMNNVEQSEGFTLSQIIKAYMYRMQKMIPSLQDGINL